MNPNRVVKSQVNDNNSTNKKKSRIVGKLGLNGTFGFFIFSKFYPCDKPKRLVNNTDGSFTIPDDINYYHKCVYFEDDLTKKFQRKIGKLGKDGYFVFYENGIYIEYERSKRVETDPKMPNVYFIPNYIN